MFFTLFLLLLVLTVLVSLGFAVYALRRRDIPGAVFFALIVLASAAYTAGYACELFVSGLAAKLFWDTVQFTPSDLLVVGYVLFALDYTRRPALVRRLAPLLFIVPIVNGLVVWTDPLHHLVRLSSSLVVFDGLTFLSYEYGPWYFIYLFYCPSAISSCCRCGPGRCFTSGFSTWRLSPAIISSMRCTMGCWWSMCSSGLLIATRALARCCIV
jgi:hypothetical protein